jgi:hypothetical protein
MPMNASPSAPERSTIFRRRILKLSARAEVIDLGMLSDGALSIIHCASDSFFRALRRLS